MSDIRNKTIFSKKAAQLFLRPTLWTHNFSYKLAGHLASIVNNGVHPKHKIIKYKEWFLDRISTEDVVLDIGCSTGMLPALLADKARFVYGIEINPDSINVAKKINQKDNIEYIASDATKYDYGGCIPINCIVLSNVLEHIEHRAEFLKKLTTYVNWKNPKNKKFLFRVPMLERDWLVLYKKQIGIDYRLDSTHYVEYTVAQFENELKQAGITIQEIETRFGEIFAVCKAV
jgi:SAM-dependent methyltransferase